MAQQWIATGPGGPETWQFVEADVPAPAAGEVTIRVAAAGVNPADAEHVAVERGQRWPVAIGYEVAGTISAVGAGARIGSGEVAVGDEVLAFRVQGGYATDLTVDASRVFLSVVVPPGAPVRWGAGLLRSRVARAHLLGR